MINCITIQFSDIVGNNLNNSEVECSILIGQSHEGVRYFHMTCYNINKKRKIIIIGKSLWTWHIPDHAVIQNNSLFCVSCHITPLDVYYFRITACSRSVLSLTYCPALFISWSVFSLHYHPLPNIYQNTRTVVGNV